MNLLRNFTVIVLYVSAFSFCSCHAYEVTVKNKTLRELVVRVSMAAAIEKRKHSDWTNLKAGESFSYNSGAMLVKGIDVKLAGTNKMILSESADPAMAIRPDYKIFSTVTPNTNGTSAEVFHLLRMPNIPLSRPGGIVSVSDKILFNDQTKQACRDEGSSDWTYDQYHFAIAHNAFTSSKYGYGIDPQQDLTLSEQLQVGVRGFMLDTYMYEGKVVVQHSKDYDKLLKLGKAPTFLEKRLDEIAKFMREHKHVIVTVIFEDYVKNDVKLLDNALSKYSDLILKPSDWSPFDKNGWPTLGWMREQGKRMILLKDTSDSSEYVFSSEWKYHAENQFSVTDKETCATERSPSKKNALKRSRIPLVLFINYFSSFNALDYKTTKLGYKDSLKSVLDYIKSNGLEGQYKGINPNGIAVDFVEWGDALDLVHQWNESKCK